MCRHKQKASNKLPAFLVLMNRTNWGRKGGGGKMLGDPTEAQGCYEQTFDTTDTCVLNGRDGVGDKRVGVYVYMNRNIERLFGYKDCY